MRCSKYIITMMFVLFTFGMVIPVVAQENSNNIDQSITILKKYTELDESNIPFIRTDIMEEQNENKATITLAEMVNELAISYKNQKLSHNKVIKRIRRGLIPTYGNWCGPGHTMDDRNGNAIDILDWACKDHDICYRDNGYWNIDCDKRFIKQLKAILDSDVLSPDGRLYASAAYTLFSTMRNYGG